MREVIGIKEASTNLISYVFTSERFSIGDMLIIGNGKGEYIYECARESEPYNPLSHKIFEAQTVRSASSDELLTYIDHQSQTAAFKQVFKVMTKELNVNASIVSIEVALDGEHIRYTYFSIDKLHFPKMIKYLLVNNPKRMKIEFYQVGEREYYAINGGLGVCGYELCCHSRGHHTPTITTNSLKAMGINIALKKALTGSCGKYKCCLLFEPTEAKKLEQNLPDLDSQFEYKAELVTVTQIDLESRIVTVLGKEVIEIEFDYFVKGTNVSN